MTDQLSLLGIVATIPTRTTDMKQITKQNKAQSATRNQAQPKYIALAPTYPEAIGTNYPPH